MPKLLPALLVSLMALVAVTTYWFIMGTTPTNAPDALLAGLMRPVFAIDTLVFLIAAALLGVMAGPGGWAVPLGFALCSLGGSAFALGFWGAPAIFYNAHGIAMLLMVGLLLGNRTGPWFLLLAQVLGFAVGTTLAAPMVTAAPGPMITFLLGLGLSQGGLALAAWVAAQRMAPMGDLKLREVHLAVALVLVVYGVVTLI
jgi:hypothetical protein